MTTEMNAAPDAAAEIDASVLPENAESAPVDGEKQEQEDPIKALEQRLEKERAAFQRRMNRKHAEVVEARTRAQIAEERARQPEAETEPKAPKPEDIERLAEEKATVREFAKRGAAVFAAGAKAYGDAFKSDLQSVIEEAGPLVNERGLPTALGDAITDSDHPEKLIHHLATNPELAESLQGLSPAALGRRLARIEAEVTAPPKPSKAPQPLTPVKGGKSGELSADDPDYTAKYLKKLRGG